MFVRGPNPIWFFDNLVGQPFDDTYYAFFLTNDLPYTPQAVYQDPNGLFPWSDPIEFQPSSGLPNNLYFDPTLVYRIEFRQGPDQTYPLIYLVENYVVGAGGSSDVISDPLITAQNLITNPQFADILFVSPLVIDTAGTYDLGPGWTFVVTGSGTTTITQVSDPGIDQVSGNPSYYLTFANSGWSTAQLIQTFSNNGAIFGGGAIAVAFTAFSTGSAQNITVSYQPSTGPGIPILSKSVPTGAFTSYAEAVDVPLSTSTDTGQNAFVNIIFALPTSGIISLTNIQITGQSVPLTMGFINNPTPPMFQEITYERVVDQEFHVYQDSLLTQPKDNLLAGWTFGLNPWQFTSTALATVFFNQYTADQTIIVQQNYVGYGFVGSVAVGQGTAAQNYGFVVQAVNNNNGFAIIQYIDPSTIRPYWGQNLSAMVNASIVTINNTVCRFKVRLIYNASLPSTTSRTYPISTWLLGTEPGFASGWTAIEPLNDPAYTLGAQNQNFSFDQFLLPSNTSPTMTLGIVIYTIDDLSIVGTPDSVLFNRVSLVPNDYAIDASPETWDESLKKCQFYYEKSYDIGTNIGTSTNSNNVMASQNTVFLNILTGFWNIFPQAFSIVFKRTKARQNPVVNIYSITTPTLNVVTIVLFVAGVPVTSANVSISNWSLLGSSIGTDNANYIPASSTPLIPNYSSSSPNATSIVIFHYTADSRLGI